MTTTTATAVDTQATTAQVEPITEHCPQAWPGGVSDFLWELASGRGFLTECARRPRHTGKHRNEAKDLEWWGGKLSDSEEERIAILRADSTKVMPQ